MEILITLLIVAFAIFIIYKTIRNSSKGKCNCGSCSKSCSARDTDDCGKIELIKKSKK